MDSFHSRQIIRADGNSRMGVSFVRVGISI